MMKIFFYLLMLTIVYSSCGKKPTVIAPSTENNSQTSVSNTGIFSDNSSTEVSASPRNTNRTVENQDMHTVVVKEILPTEKYVYLLVQEENEEFWIATGKQPVEIGEQYFYRGGLLKTNFESKEYGRTFDKIFLVSKLVSTNHGHSHENTTITNTPTEDSESTVKHDSQKKIVHEKGYTKIKDLVTNPEKYQGTEVLLIGKCVKVNPNIMGRNWIHLQDGTKDDYDLVVTSKIPVPEGHIVKLKGIVALDQDFGAGYRYNILVENAQLIMEK